MKFTVSEMAKQSGVSKRTLHYYDEIGLLKPTLVSDSGYRYYDKEALEVLQQILFYRELDFPLQEIKRLMSLPDYDRSHALEGHRELLLLKKERLEGLIRLVEDTLRGDKNMSFKEFDMTEIENARKAYADEAMERWGGTESYRESERKTACYNKEDWARISGEADEIFAGFAKCSLEHLPISSPRAQELVSAWQRHITCHYYVCTDEILASLGQMYVNDERFRQNIDRAGEGTAQYMSDAILSYTDRQK